MFLPIFTVVLTFLNRSSIFYTVIKMINNEFITRYRTLPIAYIESEYIYDELNANEKKTEIHTSIHNHKEIELLCVTSGVGNMTIGGIDYNIEKDDILIVNPMEVHYGEYPLNQDKFSFFCIDFDTELIRFKENTYLVDDIDNGDIRYMHVIEHDNPHNKILRDYLEKIYNSLISEKKAWEYEVRGNLMFFFSILISNNLTEKIVYTTKNIKKNYFINNILSYIKANYRDPVTSRDAARELSYNNSYFCRLFKSSFNKSFGEYLNIYRVHKARELLENSNMSVSDVSSYTGFGCASYFTECFKKHIGCLPSQYRKTK